LLIGEAHRGDAEVALARKAGRIGFGRLHEGERGRMRAEEGFERRALQVCRVARCQGTEEF
jgi:hypothetical protein